VKFHSEAEGYVKFHSENKGYVKFHSENKGYVKFYSETKGYVLDRSETWVTLSEKVQKLCFRRTMLLILAIAAERCSGRMPLMLMHELLGSSRQHSCIVCKRSLV
jgi:hypothetical protein